MFTLLISKILFSNEISLNTGNQFTDSDVISILRDIPDKPNKEYTNDIIQLLSSSNLFSDVKVKVENNKFLIVVKRVKILIKFILRIMKD